MLITQTVVISFVHNPNTQVLQLKKGAEKIGFILGQGLAEKILGALPSFAREDPLLVFHWNEQRLTVLDTNEFNSPNVQNQLQAAGLQNAVNTKEAVLAWMDRNGAQTIGPVNAQEDVRFFREPSDMVSCKQGLKQALRYAHVLSPMAAEYTNNPVVAPIARTLVVVKTERVKPDLYEGDFFYL